MGGASPDEPGRMQRATRATRGMRVPKQVGGKTGTVKPTKLNIKPRSYEPMPLKYRCLRAAEEYRQRFIKRAEALQRRNQLERQHRDTYRSEMMTLIKKQRKHKGGGLLAREGTQQSGQLPAPQAVPAAQKRHIEKPAIAPKRSPEKLSVRSQMQVQPPTQPQPQPSRAPFPAAVPVPTQTPAAVSARAPDKPEAGRSTAQKMLPVEVDGRTLQLDIGALNSVQEVVRAVKELHSTLAWSANPVLIYTREANAKVFHRIYLGNNTPWRHFVNTATGITCVRR